MLRKLFCPHYFKVLDTTYLGENLLGAHAFKLFFRCVRCRKLKEEIYGGYPTRKAAKLAAEKAVELEKEIEGR